MSHNAPDTAGSASRRLCLIVMVSACLLLCTSCDSGAPESSSGSKDAGSSEMSSAAESGSPGSAALNSSGPESGDPTPTSVGTGDSSSRRNRFSSIEEVHAAIRKVNPQYTGAGQVRLDEEGRVMAAALPECGISDISFLGSWPLLSLDLQANPVDDISPLKGMMTLQELFLERTNVRDLTPLFGLQIRNMYLSNTPVVDLMPLAEMPLESLNLVGTGVHDVLPLSRSPIRMLWLSETPVEDITPLMACPLESLTLHRTPVADISALAGTTLQRLHIGETEVRDLTPVGSIPLRRLIFTPSKIEKGMEVVRQMPMLTELGTTFETRMPPQQFWQLMDAGQLP